MDGRPTSAEAVAWRKRYGTVEAAADIAEASGEWADSCTVGPGLSYWERVAYVLEMIKKGQETSSTRRRGSNPIRKVPLERALKRLAGPGGASRNVLAAMEGLSKRKADRIVAWNKDGSLAWSERDGVHYPLGTREAEDGKSVRLPPLPDSSPSRSRPRPRPPRASDDEPHIW
jgi:hypothetical protein